MSARIIVAQQGSGFVVLGTDAITEASAALPAGIVGWASSHPGMYVKRQGLWRFRPPVSLPKDARPGVQFVGVRTSSRAPRDLNSEGRA